jgi:hypothetical protein
MADVNVRSDAVDVEQIMRQIRARIREKRGADYTEAELQQLAKVKLEKFLDPRGVRSDLLEQFRAQRTSAPPLSNFEFGEGTLYETHRGPLRALRRLLSPILKLFFNPDKITTALHLQSQLNTHLIRLDQHEPLMYELIHNLTVEITRLGIEVQTLKMRVESLSSRLDFDERRGRALEGVVQYRPPPRQAPAAPDQTAALAAPSPQSSPRPGQPPAPAGDGDGGERRRRRRRRRRRPGQTLADGQPTGNATPGDRGQSRSDGNSRQAGADDAGGPFDDGGHDGPDDTDQ